MAATQAEMGIIPHEAAREIDRAAQVERFDLTQLGRESLETGHLLVPTIRALARSCEGSWGEYVHYGVTTQDILDTGGCAEFCVTGVRVTAAAGGLRS
ncbi:adenylosuccinate lyase domain protein [Pseudomonas aeruginosa]|nr:adenylosuccinate lyase domain protein [Pseudomonas aeruginosa]